VYHHSILYESEKLIPDGPREMMDRIHGEVREKQIRHARRQCPDDSVRAIWVDVLARVHEHLLPPLLLSEIPIFHQGRTIRDDR
jgi:hypothetical protein